MPEPPDPEPADGSRANNTATGNAKVDAQIGYVEGDAVFHKHETTYQIADGDSAERKYQVARNFIDGGIPRLAEDLIGQALNSGFATTEVAYYYAISVLSERSLNQLGPNELDKLDRAIRIARQFPRDEWVLAIFVIGDLVQCVVRPDSDNDQNGALHIVLDEFTALAEPRQAEITRHLDMIFTGAVQEQLERLNAKTVAVERAKGDRADRAWKFFHPDPTEPRCAAPIRLRHGKPRLVAWAGAAVGVAGFGALLILDTENYDVLLGPLGLFLVGALIAGRYGTPVQALWIRRQMKESERAGIDTLDESVDESDLNVWMRFARKTGKRVNYYFGVRAPVKNKEKWNEITAGIKAALHARLVRLYGTGQVPAPTLNWLIRWHAKRAAEQWRAETLPDFRRTLQPEPSVVLGLCAGAVVASGGAAWLVSVSTPSGFAPTAISIAQIVIGCLGALGITYLFSDSQAMARERDELNTLFDDEQQEYKRWVERLSDRPTDAEMANWLEYDKSYVKTLAMRRCSLNNHDVVAHVVLTAGKPGTNRARVIHGPPRFSKYVILVFLLTKYGVREVDVDLNFLTGTIYDERRTAFSYDALASAQVLEKGFKAAKGQQHVLLLERDVRLTDKSSLVISRTFQLSLVNDQKIEVVVDNYEGLLDETAENKSLLDDMALDSSGVAVALQILEAVAAEGREWIDREQGRRNRRWKEWERGRRGRAALAGRPWPPAIEPHTTTPDETPSINGRPE